MLRTLRWVPTFLIASSIVASAFLLSEAIRDFKRFNQFVEVRGLSERIVKSNSASLQITFVVSGSDTLKIYEETKKAQENIRAHLVATGFNEAEIQNNSVNVQDNLANAYGNTNNKMPRFTARGQIVLSSDKVDNVTKANETINELVQKGVAIENSFVRYYFTDINSVKPEMLKEATENARQAAQSFAADSGVELGTLKKATQGLFSIDSPVADYDAGQSLMKKIRVVTQVEYFLK